MSQSNNTSVDLNRLKIDKDLKQSSSKGWKIFLFLACMIILTGIVWFFWSKNNIQSIELTEVQHNVFSDERQIR
jgi:hypothetical protein